MQEEDTKGKILGYDKKMLITVAVLVIVAGGAFYIGAKYEKNKFIKLGLTKNASDVCQSAVSISGEIVSKNEQALNLKAVDGNIQQVFISNATKMSKKSTGTLADLAVGQQVSVQGLKNADGSFLAQTVKTAVAASETK